MKQEQSENVCNDERTSVGSIINFVPATVVSYWNGPSHFLGVHLRVKSNLKYWLENRVGLTTQGLSSDVST